MASKAFFVVIVVLATVGVPAAMAKEFVVGDESGWKLEFDYKLWATGKQFYVGDSLVFNYPQGVHNVFKVNQTEFDGCEFPLTEDPLTTGADHIPLKEAGKKLYVCGVGQHCIKGMKLEIDVKEQWEGAVVFAPAPSPSEKSQSAATEFASSLMIGAALAIFLIVLS